MLKEEQKNNRTGQYKRAARAGIKQKKREKANYAHLYVKRRRHLFFFSIARRDVYTGRGEERRRSTSSSAMGKVPSVVFQNKRRVFVSACMERNGIDAVVDACRRRLIV